MIALEEISLSNERFLNDGMVRGQLYCIFLLLVFIVALAFVAVARSVANSMLLIYKSTPPQRHSLISALLKIQKLISGNDAVETFHRKGGCIKATGVR
jgi:hypothetical protein